MNFLNKRRVAGLVGTCALVFGGVAGAAVGGAGPADAATCTAGVSSCLITGTASLGIGTLSATTPSTLTWSTTLNGLDQNLVDTVPADEGYTVDDATGSSFGWHVTVSATTFTSTTPTAATLADTGTFSTNGSVTSATDTTGPAAACSTGSTCTLPTNTVTYPVAITTAATGPTPVSIYSAAAPTGVGSIDIGGSTSANPVGWWLAVPGTTATGTYTSTITVDVVSGP